MGKDKKDIIGSGRPVIQNTTGKIKSYPYLLIALLFVFSATYFYLFGNYIFFYQENQLLFVFSGEYLHRFASKPGGLLEYAGNFFIQFYFSNILGTFILAAIFTLLAVTFMQINRKLFPDSTLSLPLAILPSCFLLLTQTNFNYFLHNNLGFLLVAAYFLFSVSSDKKPRRIITLIVFPLFFYIAGGYAWVFLGTLIFYDLFRKQAIYPVYLSIIALLTLYLSKEVIFMQPLHKLLFSPFPSIEFFKNPVVLYLLLGIFILYPVLLKIVSMIKIRQEYAGTVSVYSVLLIFSFTLFFLSRLYNPVDADLFKIEKSVYRQDWDSVIKYQESKQSANFVSQYYYNIALAEKGLLCDRMFFARQDFGTRTVMIPWDSRANINTIFRGVYFFYTVGLINEAHRWAFESMVIQGYRPENIKLLIKTDLINGHYKVAEKYINVLKKTLHYRNWAKKYEAMLYHPELIEADPELGGKIRLQPREDFPIRFKNPQANIMLLLQSNPDNRKAFEYKIAWYLLEKNVAGTVSDIGKLKEMGYDKIPRHMEEAAVFFGAKMGNLPDFAGMTISKETESRFVQYENTINRMSPDKSSKASGIPAAVRNTYWYYLGIHRSL